MWAAMTARAEEANAVDDLSALSDAELVALVTEKNPAALEVLYKRYSRIVYSFGLRIVGDPQIAEELLQEVFFRTWRQGALFRSSRGAFVTWLLSITHNMAIDELRKRNRRPQKADSEEPEALLAAMADTSQDVEQEVWLSSLRATISEAMQTLPPAQRVTIEMAYFQGLTQREISERLGEPLGTIKTRMRLGIQKLREQLGDTLGDVIRSSEVDES
jgi:RNA polymerase sigma-70 factor (ECF subfamily)